MEPLQKLLQHYTQALFMLVAQSVACNGEHDLSQRCARWLLMTHDRVQSDQFPLTQQFLAQMLGVRRAGVNEVAIRLQQEGLIQYHRGVITILDRARLEERSCSCYFIVRDEFERSLGVFG
jgi:CRP-like cAMP-binding protein